MSANTFDLAAAAFTEMVRQGFHPDFPTGTEEQVERIRSDGQVTPGGQVRDLRELLWSSIDNDTSRDLDHVEWAERVEGGIRVRVGIADVSESVAKNSPIDHHALDQTKTVYTAVRNFPMIPNELSTDLTSLNQGVDRAAVVTEYVVDPQGCLQQQSIYRALVHNCAQLAYSKVGPWLEGKAEPDAKIAASAELQAQLRLQDEAARALREERVSQGALEFNRIEADPVVIDGQVKALKTAQHNRATDLIEDFMIGANETMAGLLRAAGRSCIRRVVRSPERWERIVELVGRHGTILPAEPDSAALNAFLRKKRAADAVHYPDLSLAIIKLMGAGEYVVSPGKDAKPLGHFGLAARDYAHSTAPNRRFADLVTQRLVKAMLDDEPAPYTDAELEAIALRCNLQESAGHKVERAMRKRVAAVAMSGSIGKLFRGVVTGASDKGVYVRVFDPPVEGRVIKGEQGLDVGDTLTVKLLHTDPAHAFIDFGRA
ncbi:RNB domain-containing ribonuclease [Granulicella sp. dw_53]|uniref:RNB domain-containing ribonuclease n=1 Tax=Granulicella sp. dw_53 TaxID=2719792 RepID=UPI001BD2C6B2|nr:RNB domain-containing ribonuclease [Granulicella sp. dw_53]